MNNLAVNAGYKKQLGIMRTYLKQWGIKNNDPFVKEGVL